MAFTVTLYFATVDSEWVQGAVEGDGNEKVWKFILEWEALTNIFNFIKQFCHEYFTFLFLKFVFLLCLRGGSLHYSYVHYEWNFHFLVSLNGRKFYVFKIYFINHSIYTLDELFLHFKLENRKENLCRVKKLKVQGIYLFELLFTLFL